MDSPIVNFDAKRSDVDSSINPFVILASKCEVIECSSIMVMGAHNRCSFEVTLRVNNKRFIANGSTILSAKKKASLAALGQMGNGGTTSTMNNTMKALHFAESSVDSDLSGLETEERLNAMQQDHISIKDVTKFKSSFTTDIQQRMITAPKITDHSENDRSIKASTYEPNPINNSRNCDNLDLNNTFTTSRNDKSEGPNERGGDKEGYSFNVDGTHEVVSEDKTVSTEDKTTKDPLEGEITECSVDFSTIQVMHSKMIKEPETNLERISDAIAGYLEETDLKICEKTNLNPVSNLEISRASENTLPIIEEVKEIDLIDLKMCNGSTAAKTDRDTVSNLQIGNETPITGSLNENSIQITEEVLPEGTSLHNYKVCKMNSPFAEMNKDCDFYQINESLISPTLVDVPIFNDYSVPNQFVKKPIGSNIPTKSCAKNKPLQKEKKNVPKVNTKLNSGYVPLGVESSLGQDIETKKRFLNPFVKKTQALNSAHVQNGIAVVGLSEEKTTKKATTNPLALKRKCKEIIKNPASKRIKLDVISLKDTNVNDETSYSIASGSGIELIPALFETLDETGDNNLNREETINHCLSILLSDDEITSSDLEGPSFAEKTVPVVKDIDPEMVRNNINGDAKTTKKRKVQSKFLNRNPINLGDGVLEVPVTSNTNPQVSQFKIAPKAKSPVKKLLPKVKRNSPNFKPRSHNYRQRQRYLQDLATKRKHGRANMCTETGNSVTSLNAICPGVSYQLESQMGPSPAPFFIISATFNGRSFYGHGKNKNLARLDAAKQVLDTLHKGLSPKIQPINSNHMEQPSTSSNDNNIIETLKFDQNHNQPQIRTPSFDIVNFEATNIQMTNQTGNNNDMLFPKARRLLDDHSNSHNSLGRYISPLPPRHKRIANVLPNKHQYFDKYSNNSGDSGFYQFRRMNMQCGTQGYNFDNPFSRPINFHFAGLSSNSNGGPQFSFPEPHCMLDNTPNVMPNNRKFSAHNSKQKYRGNYDTHRFGRQRDNYFPRNNRNGQCNPKPNYESPRLMSSNEHQVTEGVGNGAPRPEPPTYNNPNQFPKGLLLPQRDSDIIEKLILERFEQLTRSRPEVSNYKVLAGIVMTRHLNFQNAKVVAVATGTKCINGGNISSQGTVINDSHAEVIARRCLMKFLYTQIKYHCHPDNAKDSIFLRNPTGFKYAFTLKPQVQFHLYISTAPCGDARIFSSSDDNNNLNMSDHNHGQLRTKVEGGMGTKRIGSQYLHQAWDGIQIGEPLHTMSCSDKIARWNVLGVQGAMLATLTDPIYLSSIVLGSMFNTRHLYRAVCGRLEQSLNLLPEPFRLNRPLLGQTSMTCMRRSTKSIPSIGVNWTFGDNDIEIISLPAGREITNQVSFLCKKVFFQKFICLVQNIPDLDISQMPNIYAEVKLIADDFQKAKQELFDAFQHAELGCWVKKPIEQNEFCVYF